MKKLTTIFVDVTGTGIYEDPKHRCFSFYDKGIDEKGFYINQYLTYNQAQVWDTWNDFMVDIKHHIGKINSTDRKKLKKIEHRVPEWAKKECECDTCKKTKK